MDKRVIRAKYDDETISVYQAYRQEIAESAVRNQKFVSPPFKMERMTWIKPSFLWMMYRAGWASKEGQEHILEIRIRRDGFEWALENACLSHFDEEFHDSHGDWKATLVQSPVRIQWDPERNFHLQPLEYRSIQIGLSGPAVKRYVSEWIVEVTDITVFCKEIEELVIEGRFDEAKERVPHEEIYPLPDAIAKRIGASTQSSEA